MKSSIEKDVDRLTEDLDKAFAKYRGAYHIGSKTSESQKEKGAEKKKIKEQEITILLHCKNKTLDQFSKKWGTILSCVNSNYSFYCNT